MKQQFAWRDYAVWAGLNLAVFSPLYLGAAKLAAWRGTAARLALPQELAVPLISGFVWVYASLIILLLLPPLLLDSAQIRRLGQSGLLVSALAGLTFLIFPTQLAFERIMPASGLEATLFNAIFALDDIYNQAPSLHVAYATLCAVSYAGATRSALVKGAFLVWLTLIAASTMLVHQHHLIDIAGGFALGFGAMAITRLRPSD